MSRTVTQRALIASSQAVSELPPPDLVQADLRSTTTPLTAMFPVYRAVNFSASSVPKFNPAPPAGTLGWYGIRRIKVPDVTGTEIAWHGFRLAMSAPDINGIGWQAAPPLSMGTPNSWGVTSGMGAALCIGLNLPMTLNAWRFNPCACAPVNIAVTGGAGESGGLEDRMYFPFPAGAVDGTGRERIVQNMTPLNILVPGGTTLDVAFVLSNDVVSLVVGGGDTFHMNVIGSLIVGLPLRAPMTP